MPTTSHQCAEQSKRSMGEDASERSMASSRSHTSNTGEVSASTPGAITSLLGVHWSAPCSSLLPIEPLNGVPLCALMPTVSATAAIAACTARTEPRPGLLTCGPRRVGEWGHRVSPESTEVIYEEARALKVHQGVWIAEPLRNCTQHLRAARVSTGATRRGDGVPLQRRRRHHPRHPRLALPGTRREWFGVVTRRGDAAKHTH